MQNKQYTLIIYFIGFVIAATLAIQIYWNYKNYQVGKSQLIRDVQTSLDKAVTDYYDNVATTTTTRFFQNARTFPSWDSNQFENIAQRIDSGHIKLQSIVITDDSPTRFISDNDIKKFDSLLTNIPTKGDTSYFRTLKRKWPHSKGESTYQISGDSPEAIDSILKSLEKNTAQAGMNIKGDSYRYNFETDSSITRLEALQDLTAKIVLSFKNELVNVPKLDSIVSQELERKEISAAAHTIFYTANTKDSTIIDGDFDLKVVSTSTLLPENSQLSLGFENVAKIVFQRNLMGILLSLLLIGAVISSLLYLLKIIKEQKYLAEIKNDFISNITHEFKTPIATIGVAMESIQHFNNNNDPEKTKKYVNMSSQQVSKLNIMVEKLLETATLDSQALELEKQEVNISELLEAITQKYNSTQKKEVSFSSNSDQIWLPLDIFHIENALDNIVDNAIKYGGDKIDIACAKTKDGIQITITDNANNLLKSQVTQIFEKFYRVPKGNTHNVKGFGIGLYYTKTIIDKHNGSITVATNPTTFKIVLPYV